MVDTEVVTILQNGKPDKDTCSLSKKNKHRILWISQSNQAYEIRFNDNLSPFTGGTNFPVAAGGWAESGDIKPEAVLKRYEYHTYATLTGAMAADPDVIIQP